MEYAGPWLALSMLILADYCFLFSPSKSSFFKMDWVKFINILNLTLENENTSSKGFL
jgi:hypothetical protein